MSVSQIEIYDSKGKKTVIQPPVGYEFTGELRVPVSGEPWMGLDFRDTVYRHHTTSSDQFILRPLPTAKEQRAEKLTAIFREEYDLAHNLSAKRRAIAAIEAIFAEYLKETE